MTMRVRAPATTANVGPGFACVGIALEQSGSVVPCDVDLRAVERAVLA